MGNTTQASARERIEAILDDNSFVEIGAGVKARATDFNMQEKDTPADGVITGYGVINGSLVYVYSQNPAVLGGSIGEMHANYRTLRYGYEDGSAGYWPDRLCRIKTSGSNRCFEWFRNNLPEDVIMFRSCTADYGCLWKLRRRSCSSFRTF